MTPQLLVPIEVITNALRREAQPIGFDLHECASREAHTFASYRLFSVAGQQSFQMTGFKDLVYASVGSFVLEGEASFTPKQLLSRIGHSCASSKTAAPSLLVIEQAIRELSSVEIELDDVVTLEPNGNKFFPWLSDVERTPIISCNFEEDTLGHIAQIRLRPPLGRPLISAMPLLFRAVEAKQVVCIKPDMLPTCRMSMPMRAIALKIITRQRQKLENKRLIVDDLFAYAGFVFTRDDAGRHRRARAVETLERMLDVMAQQNTVIGGWIPNFEGRRMRAIDLLPTKSTTADAHASAQVISISSRSGAQEKGANYG